MWKPGYLDVEPQPQDPRAVEHNARDTAPRGEEHVFAQRAIFRHVHTRRRTCTGIFLTGIRPDQDSAALRSVAVFFSQERHAGHGPEGKILGVPVGFGRKKICWCMKPLRDTTEGVLQPSLERRRFTDQILHEIDHLTCGRPVPERRPASARVSASCEPFVNRLLLFPEYLFTEARH